MIETVSCFTARTRVVRQLWLSRKRNIDTRVGVPHSFVGLKHCYFLECSEDYGSLETRISLRIAFVRASRVKKFSGTKNFCCVTIWVFFFLLTSLCHRRIYPKLLRKKNKYALKECSYDFYFAILWWRRKNLVIFS